MIDRDLQRRQRAEISRILKLKQWSGNKLAQQAGVAASTINRFMNDDGVKHSLSARTMEKIRRAGEIADNSYKNYAFDAIPSHEVMIYLHGSIQAGEPMDIADNPPDLGEYVTIPEDDRFPGTPKFALRVKGDSMNMVARDGETIICIKYLDLAQDPEPGDYVIVQHRHESGLIDATMKRYVVQNGRAYLVPESTNPAHQAPITIPDNGEDDSTIIWARVIKVIRDL